MNEKLFSSNELKRLIIPLIIEQALVISVGMFDTMMVSVAGEAAVSGISLVDMINNVLINVFAGISTGGAVIASQYIGAKKHGSACETARQLVIINLFISLLTAISAIIFRHGLLSLLFGSIENDVMDNAVLYLVLSAFSYPFLAIYNASAAIFRSSGNSKVTMYISFVTNIINLLLNAVFIFAMRMGTFGAGLATLIARAAGAVIIFILLTSPQNMIYIDMKKKITVIPSMMKNILRIGIPGGFENSLFQLGRVLVVSIISLFGTVQIAANAVANNLDALGVIPGQAMGLAMITVVGRCVGAKDNEQTVYYTKKLLLITYIMGGLLNGAILLGLPLMFNLYNLSGETLALARTLVLIHNGFAILLWPASFVLPNALRAASDIKFTMIVSIFSMITFRIVFSIILGIHFNMGAIGVWIAMIMDWIFRIICFVSRIISGKWKEKSFI